MQVVNRTGGWKGYVSYGLGADISIPPFLVGCRLVADTKVTEKAIPEPKSRGYRWWYAALAPRLEVLLTGFVATVVQLSAHAQVFRTTTSLDLRALLFRAWLRERRAPLSRETGVFLIGFCEEQRTRTWLAHLFRAKMKRLVSALLRERRL